MRRSTLWFGFAAACALKSLCFISTQDYYDSHKVSEFPKESLSIAVNGTTNTTLSGGGSNNNNNSLPLLVLHIGPHKTATSTIQCELTHFRGSLHEEAQWTYLGRQYRECKRPHDSADPRYSIDTRRLIACLDHHSTTSPCDERPEWIKFEQTLAALAGESRNAVISDEAFSRMKVNDRNMELLQGTLNRYFSVKVVIVYRHYFSWLLSQYNEHYKPLPNRKFYHLWSDEGGHYIKPFVDYYTRHERERRNQGNYQHAAAKGNYQLAADASNLHPAAYLKKWWSNYYSYVIVVNMHEPGDVATNFVRQALSSVAYTVFRHQRNELKPPRRPNPSWNLDFDMLAVEARSRGLIKRSERIHRRSVAKYIEKTFEKATIDHTALPRVCLNETQLTEFLNRTLFLERTIFLERSQASLQQHEADFADAAKNFKFCNLETEELLARDDVQTIFEPLNNL